MKLSVAVIIPVLSLLSRISAQDISWSDISCSFCPIKIFVDEYEFLISDVEVKLGDNGFVRECDYDEGSIECIFDPVRTDSPPNP